jgi:2-methylcitrate dehydratase PrpD
MSIQLNALWERYGRLSPDEIPAEAGMAARQCILDWLGCALAGSTEPLSGLLRAEFAVEDGPATLIGGSQRTSAKTAALINGAAGHALDFDDTNLVGGLHATGAGLPAALALAHHLDARGLWGGRRGGIAPPA